MPANVFGKFFSEWRDGHPKCVKKNGKRFKGRKYEEKMNKVYKRMQADMYNLYPAIGEVNERRSNYSMAIIKGEKRKFCICDVEINSCYYHVAKLLIPIYFSGIPSNIKVLI